MQNSTKKFRTFAGVGALVALGIAYAYFSPSVSLRGQLTMEDYTQEDKNLEGSGSECAQREDDQIAACDSRASSMTTTCHNIEAECFANRNGEWDWISNMIGGSDYCTRVVFNDCMVPVRDFRTGCIQTANQQYELCSLNENQRDDNRMSDNCYPIMRDGLITCSSEKNDRDADCNAQLTKCNIDDELYSDTCVRHATECYSQSAAKDRACIQEAMDAQVSCVRKEIPPPPPEEDQPTTLEECNLRYARHKVRCYDAEIAERTICNTITDQVKQIRCHLEARIESATCITDAANNQTACLNALHTESSPSSNSADTTNPPEHSASSSSPDASLETTSSSYSSSMDMSYPSEPAMPSSSGDMGMPY